MGPHAGTTDTASGRRQGKAYPPAPGASGLDHFGARRGGRATLAPPQALWRPLHQGKGEDGLLLVPSTSFPWAVSSILERALYRRASPDRRARPVGRMYTPEVYGGLSPERQVIFCPCHSALSTTGAVLGPAPRPLDRFAITVQDGQIVVDTTQRLTAPSPG